MSSGTLGGRPLWGAGWPCEGQGEWGRESGGQGRAGLGVSRAVSHNLAFQRQLEYGLFPPNPDFEDWASLLTTWLATRPVIGCQNTWWPMIGCQNTWCPVIGHLIVQFTNRLNELTYTGFPLHYWILERWDFERKPYIGVHCTVIKWSRSNDQCIIAAHILAPV